MHIPKFKLYRMGSDPEILFVQPTDFDYIIMPAFDVIGRDKKKTTSSFIGTDSRPVIAEIRPSPSRNLKRHLFEIAYAVTATQDYLARSSKWKRLRLLAYPHLLSENLGGHIHVSMFTDDPLHLKLKKAGYAFGAGGHSMMAAYPAALPAASPSVAPQAAELPRHRELETEVVGAIQNRTTVSPFEWGRAMGYLLNPFEKWVQPWVPREVRNSHYGKEDHPDLVRLGTSREPFLSPWAYVHWEYRLPSTWLHHPWLAYSYLGLAKLSVLNMKKVLIEHAKIDLKAAQKLEAPEPVLGGAFGPPPTQFTVIKDGSPAEAGALFRERLAKILPGAKITNDLKNLLGIIEQTAARRDEWFTRPTPVDVEAWRRLL